MLLETPAHSLNREAKHGNLGKQTTKVALRPYVSSHLKLKMLSKGEIGKSPQLMFLSVLPHSLGSLNPRVEGIAGGM